MYTPTVLTIAGFDPYGGAGIQIDSKTIHALDGYALTATTAITAQNSQGVTGVEAVSPEMLHLQLSTLLNDIKVDAVKIGMLANASLIEVVVEVLKKYELSNIVLDPVMISSSGKAAFRIRCDCVDGKRTLSFVYFDYSEPDGNQYFTWYRLSR